MNSITLTGNICKEVELKYLPGSGKAVANFTMAVRRKFAKEGEQQADFIYIQAWGKQAENCANYLNKGSKVAVKGELRIDNYTQEGNQKTFTKVNAEEVEFLDTKNKDNTVEAKVEVAPTNDFEAIDDDDSIPF